MRLRQCFQPAFAGSVIAVLLGVIWSMSGCGGIEPSTWFSQSTPEPTPTVQPTPTVTPTPTATPTPGKRRRYGKGKAKKAQLGAAAEKSGPTSEASATPEPTATSNALRLAPALTTAEKAAQRHRGLQLIDEASTRIDGIDRAKLKPRDADDYDRVRNFIHDALEQMKQEDYLAAESLAQKASVLATELTSRVSAAGP